MGDAVYDYGFRIYNPKIAKFLSVDPLSNKYAFLTPYQFSSNSPVYLIDVDGLEGSIPDFFTDPFKYATPLLKKYAAEKAKEMIVSTSRFLIKNLILDVEYTYYAKIEIKATFGGRVSTEALKKSGLAVTSDINLGSVEVFDFAGEIDLQTGKFTGTANFLLKDGKIISSQNVSGSFAVPINGVPVGVGSGYSTSEVYNVETGETEKITKGANVGGGIAIVNLTGTAEKEIDKTTGTKTSAVKASVGLLQGSAGVAGVIEYNLLEIGVKVNSKTDEKN